MLQRMKIFGSTLKKILSQVMSIVDRSKIDVNSTPDFTKEELEYILQKLRDASYRGYEFEQFFKIYKKLVDKIKTQVK
jgi:ribosomal protein S6